MSAVILRADARALPLPDASVDAIVCDPPYGLEFMGREWDSFKPDGKRPTIGAADGTPYRRNAGTPSWAGSGNPVCLNCGGTKYDRTRPNGCACDRPTFPNESGAHMRAFQAWCERWAAEAYRVLKPGGHLLAFGGSRTWHRLVCAVEDAGFEIRDSMAWLYGSGFPKSLDVSKAIESGGGRPEDIRRMSMGNQYEPSNRGRVNYDHGGGSVMNGSAEQWAPTTDDARRWHGWGTALKPGFEPIVVARKPLAGTVAANVLAYGTGALNIGGCRVDTGGQLKWTQPRGMGYHGGSDAGAVAATQSELGRWPTNVVLSHAPLLDEHGEVVGDACVDGCVPGCPIAELDGQSGTTTSRSYGPRFGAKGDGWRLTATGTEYDDDGGASRFFPTFRYEAKAPGWERPRINGVAHPTVKPLELIRWLVRLVTPPNGLVLDMFAGSGTTVEAALMEGFDVVGVEQDAGYLPLIHARVERARIRKQPGMALYGRVKPKPQADGQGDLFADHTEEIAS